MKDFVVALVCALACSLVEVSANQHSFSLPTVLPAGPAVVQSSSSEMNTVLDDRKKPHAKLNFEAKRSGIFLNGKPFHFKGANYFGMETDILVPHGLWGGNESTTLANVAKLLSDNKFNSMRIPLAVDAVLTNAEVDVGLVVNEAELYNQFYQQKTLRYFDVLDHFIQVLADHKIVVLLDAHWLNHLSGGITELWYTTEENKNDFENAWKILVHRYKNAWNVIGADLKNEPHGAASWGSYKVSTDFRLASLKWGTSILQIAPRWLIFVEGQQFSSRDVEEYGAFWGENLMDVQRAPLYLPVKNRLVYSPHVYGPTVYNQPYFADPTYPDNMPPIWDLHFGFVQGVYGPLVMGEWGGSYRTEEDRKWQDRFASFLKQRSIGSFVWCVNPNSGDTEGLVENDWNTPRVDKLTMLSIFEGTPIP